ncbi:DUF2591 family protein [Oxalobacteraceae bacterium R-40]|uniref:DUF2591 family protein n=1 Tax=Keguizhuia sedimenti TaxID=3064264 RepID=A0ABU1BKN3_9BURK|nr:DUF2591 family protein [Oxalobacteraceae bacterium R-40]
MRISEIDNTALDRWVAKAEGIEVRYSNAGEFWRVLGEIDEIHWLPHRDWAQAGPIIEREKIAVFPYGDQWSAAIGNDVKNLIGKTDAAEPEYIGSTPLIAAMRCYIAHRFSTEELENN